MSGFRHSLNRKFLKRRREGHKKDFEFLSPFERKRRTCHRVADLEHFCAGFRAIAEKRAKEGLPVHMILDIEGDFVVEGTSKRKPDPFYWHKAQLRKDGVSKEELEKKDRDSGIPQRRRSEVRKILLGSARKASSIPV